MGFAKTLENSKNQFKNQTKIADSKYLQREFGNPKNKIENSYEKTGKFLENSIIQPTKKLFYHTCHTMGSIGIIFFSTGLLGTATTHYVKKNIEPASKLELVIKDIFNIPISTPKITSFAINNYIDNENLALAYAACTATLLASAILYKKSKNKLYTLKEKI